VADYRYRPVKVGGEAYCAYFNGRGAPSCIIGHVFAYKGLTKANVGRLNTENGVVSLTWSGFLSVDDQTEEILKEAQNAQDAGKTWGEALAAAERVAAS
jgi:hypothetical protein